MALLQLGALNFDPVFEVNEVSPFDNTLPGISGTLLAEEVLGPGNLDIVLGSGQGANFSASGQIVIEEGGGGQEETLYYTSKSVDTLTLATAITITHPISSAVRELNKVITFDGLAENFGYFDDAELASIDDIAVEIWFELSGTLGANSKARIILRAQGDNERYEIGIAAGNLAKIYHISAAEAETEIWTSPAAEMW